jgi:hypothetical protein
MPGDSKGPGVSVIFDLRLLICDLSTLLRPPVNRIKDRLSDLFMSGDLGLVAPCLSGTRNSKIVTQKSKF